MKPLFNPSLNFLILSLTFVLGFASGCQKTTTPHKIVGVTQILEHPSLDQERQGMMIALKEAGYVEGNNLKVSYFNAQGNLSVAVQIAQKIASMRPDVAVGISTASAQTLMSALQEHRVPLLFSAVFDPMAAKLVQSNGEPVKNITGITDAVSPESQIELVKHFVPQVKQIGFVYNPGEVNSTAALRSLEAAAQKYGITIIASPANTTGEVPSATTHLVSKVQAIYVPTDNTAVASMRTIVQVGISNNIPVFAADIGSVEMGAVAMAGYDRIELGKILGKMVVQVLQGVQPESIPLAKNHPIKYVINSDSAKNMHVSVPAKLPGAVQFIN
jgi:putative ABC transport system substrate-binding protein